MKRIFSLRGALALLIGLTLSLAACGSDDDAAEDTGAADTAEESTEAAEEEAAEAPEAEEEAEEEEAMDDSGIGVTLNDEFELLLDADVAAGPVTFNVSNVGPDFPHALTIVRAASIDDLPRNEANGAIDTEAMDPADIVGSTAVPMASGTAEDLAVDLEAGDYVFFCPIQNETQSHVAAGQIISVSVGG